MINLAPEDTACRAFWEPVAYSREGTEVAWICSRCNIIHHSRDYWMRQRERIGKMRYKDPTP